MLSRLSAALSVRMRLIVLSVIPVVGFVAVGAAYVSSEYTVDAAFNSVQQSSRLADASRAFKDALITMQMRAKDFVAQPQPVLITRFGDAHAAAMANLKIIQELTAASERQSLTLLEGRVLNLQKTFASLVAHQDELGLSEFEGTQGKLRDNGNQMERIANEDLSWLSDADQKKILIPLMLMRRFEVEYRLTREDSAASLVRDEREKFERAFATIVAAQVMKQQLTDQVKSYSDAFVEWVGNSGNISRAFRP
jgi:hypothetical protein